MAQGLKEGQLSKQKCSCAFQSLLPLYSPAVSMVNVQGLIPLTKMMVYLPGLVPCGRDGMRGPDSKGVRINCQ